MPANSEPIITLEAPAASAFTTSPENLTPPSAITGTSARRATRAASTTAVNCGTPTPATIRVVQIEPGPTPTFTADTPALISASVPSAVATLPPTSGSSGNSRRSSATVSITPFEWPCAVSTTTTSTPASTSAWARSAVSSPDADRRAAAQPALRVLARVPGSARSSRCP